MIEKEQWPVNNYPNVNALGISRLHSDSWSNSWDLSEAQSSFWIKSHTGDNFSTGPVNKTVPSFRNSLTSMSGDGRHSEHFTQKSIYTYCVCTVL